MDRSVRQLPVELERLAALSQDLRVVRSKLLGRIWRRLDAEAWDRTNNPHIVLQHVRQEQLDAVAADAELMAELAGWLERHDAFQADPGWFGGDPGRSPLSSVAYLSMEFGISEALPIYSGGLGILAGDHLKSASDLGVPLVGVGLLYQQGYFRQVLGADGWQHEAYPFNDPGSLPVRPVYDDAGRWPRVRLELPGRTLLLRVWQAQVGRVTLYLLDSNHPLNTPLDRGITAQLYGSGPENRLLQELVLGVGGWRLLRKLGHDPEVCHLNEGHAAFAVIARALDFAERRGVSFAVALRATRAGNVFTTHTPVDAAFDRFEPGLIMDLAGPLVAETGLSREAFLGLGRRDPSDAAEPFNMAWLALRGSGAVNGVARLHARVSRRLFAPSFPGWPEAEVPVAAITNGVHVPTWRSDSVDAIWSRALGREAAWLRELGAASDGLADLSDETLWAYRAAARATLVVYVRERLARQRTRRSSAPDAATTASRDRVLDPNTLTLGFARRFAGYKRPDLLLHDEQRLAAILTDPRRPCQLIVAGKAHPHDEGGKAMIQRWASFAERADVMGRVVFLEDYDMVLAQQLASGVDVWLNTPRRPLEACGTSGMKMLVNGGLNCSTLDGWWDEGYRPDAGWAIGGRIDHDGSGDAQDALALYALLEGAITRTFYERDGRGIPTSWVGMVRTSMARLTGGFSSDRMVRQYVEEAYVPAASAYRQRAGEDGRLAAEIEAWAQRLGRDWPQVRLRRRQVVSTGDRLQVRVEVYLGDLTPDMVRVELYADGSDDGPPIIVRMEAEGPVVGGVNVHGYRAFVAADRPAGHFTPRVVPDHPAASIPLEVPLITWWTPAALHDEPDRVAAEPPVDEGADLVPA